MKISIDSIIKIVGVSLFIAAVCFSIYKYSYLIPSAGTSVPKVVTFDVIKYANAQRAVASTFLSKSADTGEASQILLDLPKRARDEISSVAGPSTLVLIKQSVVQGQFEDITDKVLTNLNLPTNVPTADSTAKYMNMAPTNLELQDIPKKAKPISSSPQVLP